MIDESAMAGGSQEDEREPARDGRLGPVPVVAGYERIRQDVWARLFGEPSTDDTEPGEGPTDAAGLDDPATMPETLGRFRLLARLGQGGMGVVYRAHDPELGRDVAIKLLRPDLESAQQDSHGRPRLLREAQAMARLSHPNVITVHEVGTIDGRVFVCMEYVEGRTLRAFMNASPPLDEVLRVFVAAGRGLAAAHRAGLVHRDFKPDNVLIGTDGRVRVLDFGLARVSSDPVVAPTEGADTASTDRLGLRLTRTGAVMGTPAYMSPEQHLGRPADARSDQFSFCVALFEGLYGVRPFEGKTLPELVDNVIAGLVRVPAGTARVPAHVQRAVLRGLSSRVDERFESMDALLEALGRDPYARVRWAGLVVVVGSVASAATFVLGDFSVEACSDVRAELADVWDEGRRAEVERAFLGTSVPFAADVWRTTATMLDAYATRWVETRARVCAASLVSASEALAVRQSACLDARRAELQALTRLLAQADAELVAQAVGAVSNLTDLSSCEDARRLEAWAAPQSAEARQERAQTRAQLAGAKAAGLVGRYDEAIAVADAVVGKSRILSDPGLEAAALLVRGQYEERSGDPARAEQTLREAMARAGHAQDHVGHVRASIILVYVLGQQKRVEEAKAAAAEARAILRVIGSDPVLEAELDQNLGTVLHVAGSDREALALHQRSLQTYRRLYGEQHPAVAKQHANIGACASMLDRTADAELHLRKAIDGMRAVLGPDHPSLATAHGSLGLHLARVGRHDEAVSHLRESLRVRERNLAGEHPAVARTLYNLAWSLYMAGRYEEARTEALRSLQMKEKELPEDDPGLVAWWKLLAGIELMLEHREQARALFEKAIAVRQREQDDPPDLAVLQYHLSRTLYPDDPARARALAREASERAPDDVTLRGWLGLVDSVEVLRTARGR